MNIRETFNIRKIKSQFSEELRREQRIRLRIKIVTGVVCVMFFMVSARAIELHCIKNSALKWIANKQYQAVIPQSLRRGRILDRNGKELAVSLPVPSIYADPRMVSLTDEERALLGSSLGIDEKDLASKLKQGKKFVWLKRTVDNETLQSLKGLQGIFSIEESKRFYPNGELASQILGAVGFDSEALAGIELSFDEHLASKNKEAVYRRDARGKFYFSPVDYREQDDVNDVYLTIDKQIQFTAENALQKAVTSANASGGTAVVMDVTTGAILAMANRPSFDPNNYSKYPQETWRNRAITDTIEPGSTFKVLIASAGLDSDSVKPESMIDCEKGAIKIGKAVLHDHNPYGQLSVRDIMKVSSNIGALKIAREVGKDQIYRYLKKFGIGNKTGIDFPGEVSGVLRDPSTWQPVELGTIAFGQGLTVTPLQMATAFAGIANGGKVMKPYMIDRIINNQGMLVTQNKPKLVSQAISKETALTIINILEGVVGEGGTGTKAASKEYQVAGKTGTAQKVTEGSGYYAKGKYYSSFIGMAPTNKPKIVVFVGLDEPKGAHYGGTVSAPAFKEITEVTLKFLDVPSNLSHVVVANKGFTSDIQELAENTGGNRRFLRAGEGVFYVPDVKGITMRDVMESVGSATVKLKVEGSGVAFEQSPDPGNIIGEGEEFRVSFRQP
ncbi:MAG: penicillin-binding protein [Deltaproteobacteria bacterium CG11_big_fil_rev_8_21_14_0_20_49_13]|nr:MAG: penicillin-binding protein [Deltaproteobacteria bacterium CG11_big_fil_rev_8_21_14_0_20_49_13]